MQLPASQALVPELLVRESSPSTNAELAELVRREPLPTFTTLVTDDQTAGRGRLDRTWVAPAGTALAISVLVAPRDVPLERFGWLPILAGMAMTATLRQLLPGADVGFKWPNDVLVDGRKISGVLAELVLEQRAAVVGAGVNLAMSEGQLPVASATSVVISGGDADPDTLLSGYLRRLIRLVTSFEAAGGDAEAADLVAQARILCTSLGRDVSVELPGGRLLDGVATDLDADGRLLVRDAAGAVHAIAAGDVTHARLT